MPVRKDNTAAALAGLQQDLARRLLAAAVTLVSELQRRVSTSAGPVRRKRQRDTAAGKRGSSYTAYANPSRVGDYPHLRSGHGRANYAYEPTTVEGVIAAGLRVRIGVRELGKHMLILELKRGRKGVLATARDLKGQLKVAVSQKGA